MTDEAQTPTGNGSFPPTRPSIVAAVRSDDPTARRAAFERIGASYSAPVYKYLRLRHAKGKEDAEDLLQGFFVSLLERETLATFDPAKARFRTFLRVCLDRFVINAAVAARADKRGGANQKRLDVTLLEADLASSNIAPIAEAEAEAFFLKEWRRALFEAAIGDVRDECARHGRTLRMQVFERLDIAACDPRPSYAALARELATEVGTIANELAAARREFRRALLDRLREQTIDESEFKDELGSLLGGAL